MRADAFRHAFQAGLWRDAAAAPAPDLAKHHADKLLRAAALEDADDWAGLSQLTDLQLSLNEGPAAIRSLLAAIPLAPPEALDELLEAAYAALRGADPDEAAAILQALSARFPGERQAFDDALAAAPGAGPAPEHGDGRQQMLISCLAEACAAAGHWDAAVDRFMRVPGGHGVLPENLSELARCVGRRYAPERALRFRAPGGPRRVFDLFPYNGELLALKIRLDETASWVEKFIIVEARKTFSGLDKPLYYLEHKAELEAYADKIVHVVVDAAPPELTLAWAREFHQRDSAVLGLSGLCAPDDLVLISDVDEILRREVVEAFDGVAASAELRTFRMFLNCEVVRETRPRKTAMVRARLLADNGSNYLRLGLARYHRRHSVRGAGWHFTSVNDAEVLEMKFKSYSHEENAHLDRPALEARLERMRTGGLKADQFRREIDDSFPGYIRRNQDALARFIL